MTSGSNALSLTLEFVRVDQGGDPYAFRMTRQEYLLRNAGGGFKSAELGWDEALLTDLDAIRRGQPEPLRLQRLGETLRRFLQPAGWSEHEAAIVAAVQARRPVVLTLRSAAAELYALPWELVTLKSTGQHLAELPGVLVRYEWPETATMPPATPLPTARCRILVGWSAAGGAVPETEHLAAIERACRDSGLPFSPQRDVIAHVSPTSLADALESAQNAGEPIAVLHLLCHSGTIGQNFGLVLDGEDAKPHVVDAGHLRRILTPYAGMIRLVILSACNSGDSGALGNQLGSVAQAVHRAGIAQVVASRYPLTIVGSIRLAQVLYHQLLGDASSVEEALLRARNSLARQDANLDWVSLQFFARASDGDFQWPSYLREGSAAPRSVPPAPARGTAVPRSSGPLAPSAVPPRAARVWTAWNLAGFLFLGAIGTLVWRVHRTPQQPVRPSVIATPQPPEAGSLAQTQRLPVPTPAPNAALVEKPEEAPAKPHRHAAEHHGHKANPEVVAGVSNVSGDQATDKHDPPPSAAAMPIYRGVLMSGSAPINAANLTLLGTDCETSTDANGVFSFKSCSDADGVSRLTSPGVIITLPTSASGARACAGKVINIEKPPAMTRIDVLERCPVREPVPQSSPDPPTSAGQMKWVNAGPIWSGADAGSKCPTVCAKAQMRWHGTEWTTTVPLVMSRCKCEPIPTASVP